MQISEPWIDPITCEMEDILDENEFHLVFLMGDSDDKFHLVTAEELVAAHSTANSPHTTNMVAVSINKRDVNGINEDGKIQTQALPRTKIMVDSVFADLDDMVKSCKEAYQHFEFI